jgi:hypothetical protein
MKITGLNSHVSITTYSCKTFHIQATCTTSGFIIIIIIINCEECERKRRDLVLGILHE